MICRKVDVRRQCSPPSLSFVIRTAKGFDCDIYIKSGEKYVDVKNYEEMMRGVSAQGQSLWFYFDGEDELAAQKKIARIFQD